ncbi:MAG: abortive infection family protein [Labilithrix sp.]|nr:abortive infection family protein [Labilithrix sp.]
MAGVRLGFGTIKGAARIIAGDWVREEESLSPYRTHALLDEFFIEDLGLKTSTPIEGSRASKTEGWLKAFNGKPEMRKILEAAVRRTDFIGTDFSADAAVAHLNEYLVHDSLSLVPYGKKFVLRSTQGVELPTASGAADILTDAYVREQVEKCDAKLARGDLEGAITNARTLLEAVLGELELRLVGAKGDYKGELPKQYKAVTKLLRLDDERPDLDDRFKDVVRGLVQTVNGLASLQNKISDRHARTRKPALHHARVVVNAAKTIAVFLVESYSFQTTAGLLKATRSAAVGT